MSAAIVGAVRDFVESEVRPVASDLEHSDTYPHALVARMRTLGLFGSLIPPAYGGLGLDVSTYAAVIEELCRGFMSLAGVINSHTMLALIVLHHGTEAQRERFLPRFASGAARGGLCLTEPHAGSDVQAIRTVARREGERYVVNGTKMFITNGREGNAFALLALTDPAVTPRHRGMSCFVIEKGHPGFRVMQSIRKLGYKGVDTVELVFEDFEVPVDNLVGGVEGRGFKHVMSGLETGRINIAARAVGVAQGALEEALSRVRVRAIRPTVPPVVIADMATRVAGARLVTRWAAAMKDRNERCDLEAGMAKLYASESAQQVATDGLRVHEAEGQLASFTAERHYRDTPLMIIGEGTNEIQRTLIARQLLARHGERPGDAADMLTSGEAPHEDRRQLVLGVRQFVDRTLVPAAMDHERTHAWPDELIAALADLGILGVLVPSDQGGLGLDLGTHTMILEELARGSATAAALASAHLTAAAVVARFGSRAQRERLLPPATRGEALLTGMWDDGIEGERTEHGWRLRGGAGLVENATRAGAFVACVTPEGRRPACMVIPRQADGVRIGAPHDTLGVRGLGIAPVRLDGVFVPDADVLGGQTVTDQDAAVTTARMLGRLGAAAMAVGIAQAAFASALRYSQERTTFGKPICEHQAVQLKLADMATAITVARLLTRHAAAEVDQGDGIQGAADASVAMAKLAATETALTVTLESMRIHGGYGYSAEFPVERYYRDAARLVLTPTTSEEERAILARRLVPV
jgi:alkylation response protein AidB-like acyl-CoA dehydrogenase